MRKYAQRLETRREHLAELQAWLNLTPFAIADYRRFVHQLVELTQQTDRGIVLAEALVELLGQQRIICAQALGKPGAHAGWAELFNAQFRQPFAVYWGDGTTSSSDGQNFKAGGRGQLASQVNLKYGQKPGVQFYTHISDQ